MRHLVRQHHFDLVIGILGEHRVGYEDAPRRADPCERRIGFLRLRRQTPLVCAEDVRTGAVGEREEAAAQAFTVERLDGIKERQQQNRREIREAYDQQRKRNSCNRPPSLRRDADAPVDHRGGAAAEHEREPERFHLIGDPRARRFVRQLVAALDEEPAVERQRQGEQLVD